MAILADPNLVGLLIQALGALLIAALCLALRSSVARQPLLYWTLGWLALFVALATLALAFRITVLQPVGQPAYVFGEYVFGYLLLAGCRLYATGRRVRAVEAWLIVPAVLLAFWLPRLGGRDFNVFFTFHALIYSYLFFASWRLLRRAHPNPRSRIGVRVMKIALILLTLDYFHYAPLFAASSYSLVPVTVPYLVYSPLYDLIFMVMLGFGMVMAVTGDVQHDLEIANAELGRRRDHLEAAAQLDHLTSALNRHAFHSFVGSSGRSNALWGCAAVADIDNLKAINDRYGHAVGDAAIRAVASAIRACIRADDLLFRWGGDEFLILLIGVDEAGARARLGSLNERLAHAELSGVGQPVEITASVGFAPFESAHSLDEVIALADEAMYGHKRQA